MYHDPPRCLTLGTMSARSSARKTAKYTKQTRNAARVAAVAGVVAARDQRRFNAQQQVPVGPPPPMLPAGWYPDAADTQFVVWWGPNDFGVLQWFPESRRHVSQLEYR